MFPQDPTSDSEFAKSEILAVQSSASKDGSRRMSPIIGSPKTKLESYSSPVYHSANTVRVINPISANSIVDTTPFTVRWATNIEHVAFQRKRKINQNPKN